MSWAVTAVGIVGTGAVISPSLVLTCWHVVEDAVSVEVQTAASPPRRFAVIDRDVQRDVAVLAPVDPDERLDDDLVVIPRSYRRGARPAHDRALVQLSITDADLPSSVGVELRPAPGSSEHVRAMVVFSPHRMTRIPHPGSA